MSEAQREAHDLFFGFPTDDNEPDERGTFAIRVVYLDGVERLDGDEYASLRAALIDADRARSNLAAAGYGRTRVHVDVIDLDDGERRLDWDTLED